MVDIIQSLKEFIWDIVGYIIPGFLLIISLNLILNPNFSSIENSFLLDWKIFGDYLPIVVSYILGYVVYSFTILKINFQDGIIDWIKKLNLKLSQNLPRIKKLLLTIKIPKTIYRLISSSHSKHWLKAAEESATFKSAKEFLKRKNYQEVDQMKYNEIRNILMFRNPDMDQKVYTFMFRSSLFDHISTVAVITIIIFAVNYFLGFNYVKDEKTIKILIFVLVVFIPLLGKCKRIFYSISQRIPLSNLK